VADDSFRIFNSTESETVASEATSFYGNGASDFIRAVTAAGQRCHFQVRPNITPLNDETIRLTFQPRPPDPTGYFGDMIIFRAGCVVLQVVTVLESGEHSGLADGLAAAVAQRASALRC
jgi:hypothetical protein